MGSIIYNKLPDHLKEIDSFKVFKKKLKLLLLCTLFIQWKNFYPHDCTLININLVKCDEYSVSIMVNCYHHKCLY